MFPNRISARRSGLVGAFFARYLAGEGLGGRFVTSLVDAVLDGLRPR